LTKEHSHIKLHIIPLQPTDNTINIARFENKIQQIYDNSLDSTHNKSNKTNNKILIITSIIHCSNITGYFTPVEQIHSILHDTANKRKKNPNICKYFFTDIACSSPYVKIDGNLFDALFLSPHKFIGGMGTPGVLIAKTCLFQKNHPVEPGGSCITKTHYNDVIYSNDIEIRESAGSMNITGIIKIGQCFLLKQKMQKIIQHNEHILQNKIQKWQSYFSHKYSDTFQYIMYPPHVQKKCLPIFAFSLKNIHFNFLVVLLNDLFGIQTRGGRSCSGIFTDYTKDSYGIEGFCRVSLHWTMSNKTVKYIFNSIDYIIENCEYYKPLYSYNKTTHLFEFI
jgi:selenocysteine lyase/cysteine desulfurase